MHRFAPQGSDAKWIGLHKVGDDFARYISVSLPYRSVHVLEAVM